ncbi:MAG TPA: MBL fold metallo-hydrolase [Burkholderiales bacterium]|nr:MBL fold metallo-hydrolase [Burkholderiales bacterium]
MARLTAISGLGSKGPACFLLETREARVLLDLGYGPQPGVLPNVDAVGTVDAVLLSHSHRDHAGGLALLEKIGNPPVYATDIVRRLLQSETKSRPLPLQGSTDIAGLRVTTGRSGHAPGGVWLHLAVDGGLLYMGDNSGESIVYASDAPPPASTIIIDASYGAYETTFDECVKKFDPVFDAGPVLLPIPVAGRGPEIALYLMRSHRAVPHIDDALRASLTRLATHDSACLKPGIAAELAQLAAESAMIEKPAGVMLAGAADATAGDAAKHVAAWEPEPTPAIVFTGYLPPGTPAERLTTSGRASYLRWNVHPRLADNAQLVRAVGAQIVLPAFGDATRHCHAWETAFAPARVVVSGCAEF